MAVNSLNLIMGAAINRKEDREENDYYKTDPKALEVFLDKLKEDGIKLSENVWEPACGDCGLSDVLNKRGYNVFSSDIVNRGSMLQHLTIDFFNMNEEWDGDILTNPPFKYAVEFIQHGLELVKDGRYVIMFLKIHFLETQDRYDRLFSKGGLRYVYLFSNRARTAMNGDFDKYRMASPTFYMWGIWEKGFKGEPTIRWIHK